MNHVSLSILAIGIAAVFSNPVSAAEGSLNGWGKAYAEAATKQAQAKAGADAMLTLKAGSPDTSGVKAAAEKGNAAVQSGVEKGKATITATSEKVKTAAGNLAAKAAESRSGAEGASVNAKLDASSNVALSRNATASAKAAGEVMALVGQGKPSAAKPEATKADAPKMDAPSANANKPADTSKTADSSKPAEGSKSAESSKTSESSKPADSGKPAATNNGSSANASLQASVGVSVGAGERKANVERPAVSLFERPQALLERPAGVIERPLALLDRPVLNRPERVGGLFR